MKDVMWFRLAVRLTGVVVIAQSLGSFGYIAEWVAWLGSWAMQASAAPSPMSFEMHRIVPSLIELLSHVARLWLGWYLLFRGEALIAYVVVEARGRCPVCQYSIKGLTTPTCPECGTAVKTAQSTP